MKFIVDIDLEPEDDGEPFTQEQVREHLQTYVFAPDVSNELSLVPDDPFHDFEGTLYRTFLVTRAEVTSVKEVTPA